MWRSDDLYGVLGDGVYPLVGLPRPETMAEVGPVAKGIVDAGANRVHLPASPLMHGTGAFTTFQALFIGASIVTLVGRHFDPDELWDDGATRARHPDGDRRRRLRETDAAGARGGRSARHAVRHLVAAAHHQLGRDVVGRGEARADAAGQLHLPRLARLERGRRVRGLDQHTGHRAEDRAVLDRREHQGLHAAGQGGRARLGRDRPARGRRLHPGRLLQGREQVGGDVPRHRRPALVGSRRLRHGRGRRNRHPARAAARS